MRKKLLIPFITISLIILSRGYSVSVETCESGIGDWQCEVNKICVCDISGSCTNGDLLVYQGDVTNLLCAPSISGSSVDIFWDDCGNPSGHIIVRADCDEGQSSEEVIDIVDLSDGGPQTTVTTSTITTTTEVYCNYVCRSTCMEDNNPPLCYERISHGTQGCPFGQVCCESILKECPSTEPGEPAITDKTCPYECCIDMPGYEYKPCPSGLSCCDNLCKESCGSTGLKIPKQIVFWIILATAIPLVAFLIFSWRRESLGDLPEY